MKVTSLLSDKLIHQVKVYSKGKNTTEAITIALKEWVALKRIKSLNERVAKNPLQFRSDYSAKEIRDFNRQS